MTHTIARHREQPHTATRRAVVAEVVVDETSERGGVSPQALCKQVDAQEPGGLRHPAQKNFTLGRVSYSLVAVWSLLATSLNAAEPTDVSADLVAVAKQHQVHGDRRGPAH